MEHPLDILDIDDVKKIAVENLIKTIKGTSCFIKYKKAKTAIARNELLMAKIAEFKTLNFKLNAQKLNGQVQFTDEERHASNIYWQLMLDKDASAFLESEKELSIFLNDIFINIAEEADLGINFFV